MILFKNYLVRDELIDRLLKYRNNTKYENNSFFEDYLKIIENEFLKSKFVSDSDFLTIGSREKIINEFYSVLTDNNHNQKKIIEDPLYFALGNIEELIFCECTINTFLPVDNLKELREKDIRYSNKKIICLEEKKIIEKMMNDLKKILFSFSSINSGNNESEKNIMNNEFKINDNIQFDKEEVKVELKKYLDEVNEYNRKIQNDEETDVSIDDLLNKYRETFYDEELENKLQDTLNKNGNFKFDKNDIDQLVIKINNRIKELEKESN